MEKRLLFITTRLFWPADSGRKVSLYYYCQGLQLKYGYDVYIYSFLEHGQSNNLLAEKPNFIKKVEVAAKISRIDKIKNLFIKSIFTMQWPLQCSLFYNEANKVKINKYIKEIKPDTVIVDMVRLAPYYEGFTNEKCLKVLDMDDLLSKRYERQLSSDTNASITGQYSANMSGLVNKIIGIKIIKNIILKFEQYLMQKAERYYGRLYDKVLFVSQKECDALNTYIGDKAVSIPMGIDVKGFRNCHYNPRNENKLCFVGNMAVAANVDTLYMIVNEILPKIKAKVTLLVIGKCPTYLKELYKEHKEVVFTGRVDVIYDYAKECDLFLAPIAYGSGIKTKILEAMAMQLPVITNSIGAEGLDMVNGEHYIVEDDCAKIAEQVDYYLEHKDKAALIAVRGQQLVFDKYDWNKIWNKFAKVLPSTGEKLK